ncbi:MAG TPA: YeeE/YedE thiosulfate transporter family protein [Sedimentisphaerales bacterium]|nr:YeeE/YedE thiosulfate transporter family protein [Sedimentisphaerales bacterium]
MEESNSQLRHPAPHRRTGNSENGNAGLTGRTHPLPWWAAGILLGLVQVLAIALVKPMGVSKQFVVADARVLERVAPEYSENHPLLSNEQNKKFGYGWWFNIGIVLGAFLAALHLRAWKVRTVSAWWQRNHDAPVLLRLIAGFCGGVLLLLGAGLAHGCITGQFISGWTQLSLSAIPFTITLFGFGMLVAYLVYPKAPSRFRREE